nr:uncharacterized protein LOC117864775 [Setaria viridis]
MGWLDLRSGNWEVRSFGKVSDSGYTRLTSKGPIYNLTIFLSLHLLIPPLAYFSRRHSPRARRPPLAPRRVAPLLFSLAPCSTHPAAFSSLPASFRRRSTRARPVAAPRAPPPPSSTPGPRPASPGALPRPGAVRELQGVLAARGPGFSLAQLLVGGVDEVRRLHESDDGGFRFVPYYASDGSRKAGGAHKGLGWFSGCESRTGTARAWGRWNRAWGFLNRARGGFPWRQWWPEARRTPATQGRRGQKRHGKLRPGAVGLPAREERI